MRKQASLMILSLALAACGTSEKPGDSYYDDAAIDSDGSPPELDGALAEGDAGGGAEGGLWIIVVDVTEGLAVGPSAGTDIDAITFSCENGQAGAASYAQGSQRGAAEGTPVGPGLGEPDGPCEAPGDCAALLGMGGWLAFQLNLANPVGCTVFIHELADITDEQFEAWICLSPNLDANCQGPFAEGADGETTDTQFVQDH